VCADHADVELFNASSWISGWDAEVNDVLTAANTRPPEESSQSRWWMCTASYQGGREQHELVGSRRADGACTGQ
jgi:hypothetical protein